MYINGTKRYALLLLGIFSFLVVSTTSAQTISINEPYIDTILCPTGTFNVVYTTSANFTGGNAFTVQLSSATGSFASPSTIGSVTAVSSGTIPCTVPAAPAGTAYRIRIVATTPAYTSVTDSKNITIANPIPATTTTATGTSPVCAGSNGIALFDAATYAVNSYSWAGPNGFVSGTHNPTVTGPVTTAMAGTYSVTTTHTGCPASTATVNITVNTIIPPSPTLTTNGHCDGSPVYFYANPDTSAPVITYYWYGPDGFISDLQNPTLPVASSFSTGYYYLTDTIFGCPSYLDSVYVGISATTPVSINITVSPNDTVCLGTNVTFTATTITGGVTPGFQWVNGTTPVVGAVYSTWSTPSLTDGDIIYCQLSSSLNCPTPNPANSNMIKMNMISHAPQVYIQASPGTSVTPGSPVTFNSVIYDAGTSPSYQWYVNGMSISGATSPTFTLPSVNTYYTVSLVVTSNLICSFPDSGISNSVFVYPSTLGVASVANAFDNVTLYPNPNNGSFTLSGNVVATDNATIEVLNALGQTVYTDKTIVTGNQLNKTINISNLPDGIYMLHIYQEGGSKIFRFAVQH